VIEVLIKAGAMGGFVLLGAWLPRDAEPRLINRDLVLNLVNGVLLVVFIGQGVAWLAPTLRLGLVALPVQADWARLLIAFVLIDFFRYWLHRAHHRIPFLWSFHRVHHSAEHLDATTGLRMHPVDFVQLALLPIVVFTVVLDTSDWPSWVLSGALGIGVIMDPFQHGNIRWNPKHPLAKLWNLALNHPLFHSWHHTRDGALCDGNYGNALVIWDRLFGSDVTGSEPPELMGLEEDQALDNSVSGWLLLRPRSQG
jgi:sterol desaturase/sphingolipid hydroxylase (fatty acid hydroxylase superfamily)